MSTIRVCAALALIAIASASPLIESEQQNAPTSLEDSIANFIQKQEISFELPIVGSTVTLGARNLNNDEVDLKVKVSQDDQARKSKLKKIFAPILILVIIKAITLIPLALGLLGLKTWNAIQLSFVTFIISIGFGVYELCKKVAADHVHHSLSHGHVPWANAARSEGAQDLAYSAYQ